MRFGNLSHHHCQEVGCKWVFRVKHKAHGSTGRFKARLVPKGFTQDLWSGLSKSICPCCKKKHYSNSCLVRLILIGTSNSFNVKNAFLHGNLEENVYMEIPPRFGTEQSKGKVCTGKALYGVKQSLELGLTDSAKQ